MIRSLTAAAAACAVSFGAASASEQGLDRLEAVCIDDGSTAETCGCLRAFVADRFTSREIDGAARLFADPELRDDVPLAIGTLMSEGYSMDEILTIANRVIELQEDAVGACEVEGATSPELEEPVDG